MINRKLTPQIEAFKQLKITPQNMTKADFLKYGTLLPYFVTAKDLNEDITADQLRIVILAGYASTARSFSSLVSILFQDKHSHILSKVQEIAVNCKNFAEFREQAYPQAIMNEMWRLHSPIEHMIRTNEEDMILHDGSFVPKGTYMDVNSRWAHEFNSIWGNGENEPSSLYDPEKMLRVMNDSSIDKDMKQLRTFSGGLRSCPGEYFAKTEVLLLLYVLTKKQCQLKIVGEPQLIERSLRGLVCEFQISNFVAM